MAGDKCNDGVGRLHLGSQWCCWHRMTSYKWGFGNVFASTVRNILLGEEWGLGVSWLFMNWCYWLIRSSTGITEILWLLVGPFLLQIPSLYWRGWSWIISDCSKSWSGCFSVGCVCYTSLRQYLWWWFIFSLTSTLLSLCVCVCVIFLFEQFKLCFPGLLTCRELTSELFEAQSFLSIKGFRHLFLCLRMSHCFNCQFITLLMPGVQPQSLSAECEDPQSGF